MIVKRHHRVLNSTSLELIEVASILTQIILEYGNRLTYLEVNSEDDEIRFTTVKTTY